jgi:hypothetical protein
MMNKLLSLLFILGFLISCTSFPEKVKTNKEKFTQVGRENAQPVQDNDIAGIYERAVSNQTEGKIKALGVDNIETNYQDSVVVFKKSDYRVIYDFAESPREGSMLEKKLQLKEVEKIDERLFLGKE